MNRVLFNCELNYFPSSHLSQIYDGFEKLRKEGIVGTSLKPVIGGDRKPLLNVKINNKHTVIYDTLDGLNWIDGSIEDNLHYFKNNIKADYCFKRSYNQQVLEHSPLNCKVYPLGLNTSFKEEGGFPGNSKQMVKDLILNNKIIERWTKRRSISSKDFEFFPTPAKNNKILFLTRLWDPEEVTVEHLKIEREILNKKRIDYIKACQKEFGKYFTGGLIEDSFLLNIQKI